MKKWLIVFGILVILIVGGYFALSFYAVKFIQARLQKVIGPGLTVTEIKIKPTYLSVKGIQYEDPHSKQRFSQIGEIRIYPALFSFLKGPFRIREFTILQPSFFFYRSREGVFIGPWEGMEKREKGREISEEREVKKGEPIRIQIDRIQISKGSIDFEDRKMGEPPARIELREIDLKIKGLQYPLVSNRSPIELKVKMIGKKKEGSIETKGWIDLKTTDMETSLKVRGIEAKTFEPYYRKKVSAEIEAGHIDMEAKIALKKKMIDAPGQLKLVDLRIREGGGSVFWIPAKMLVSLLKNREREIKVQFHVKGNMDNPQFNLQETFLTQIAIHLAQTLGIPIKVVGEGILQGTLKGEKGIVDGLKSIEELFKKKEKRR